MAKSEALQLARSVESLLHIDHISMLILDDQADIPSDNHPLGQSLARLVETTDPIYYAYILKQQNEDIFVVADSVAADSATSRPIKRVCEEMEEINRLPFDTGQSLITGPVSAPCGDWVRTLVPIFDSDHESVIAVLGLSYSAAEWQASLWKRIVVCDIDGLRVVNDAYGHEEGDHLIVKTARLIQGCLRDEYVPGHAGGGKFVLLLPGADSQAAGRLKTDIKNSIESYNRVNENAPYTISVSIGYSTKETKEQQLRDVTSKAERYLNHRKLLNQNSSHSAIVSSIMATLYAKSQETEEHGRRLGGFCQMIGKRMNLSPAELDDLQLLAKLHDIGKIGIDDSILNKPGRLSKDEWKIMKRHPGIGHRIAVTTPQLRHIADYILYHHERWDGTGYPMGLREDEIPVVSRILAIADAYDAMTENRIYRKALSEEAAMKEIKENAGTQFDPDIAGLFVDILRQESEPPAGAI